MKGKGKKKGGLQEEEERNIYQIRSATRKQKKKGESGR